MSAAVKEKACRHCGERFETAVPQRRLCGPCRSASFFGRKDPEKQAEEEARRRLPSMTIPEVVRHVEEGRRWFTNGGARWRYVLGFDGLFIYYAGSRHTTGERADSFAKWAKGAHEERGGSV